MARAAAFLDHMTAIDLPAADDAAHGQRSFTTDAGGLVLGGDYQGLGIVRSLGRQGIPVGVLDDERSIGRTSRYAAFAEPLSDLGDEERLVGELLAVGRRRGLEGWVLFPTRDETVAALSWRRDELGEFFRVATAPWDSVRWAWDKRNTHRLAEELDMPLARTWQPADEGEIEVVGGEPPWAIKPAIKEHFFYATKAKAWRADSRKELRRLVPLAWELVGPGAALVQELIPGDGRHQYAYGALYDRGRPLATMVARRRRQHPPEFGRASTFVETVEQPEVERLSERLLAHIGYHGLVELEYKQDPRDGRFKLLDFNARTWGYHTLAEAAGVDFPYLLFRRQLGLPVARQAARPGVRWVRTLTDLPTGFVQIRAGELRLRDYLASLRAADVEAVFTREDPWPGLAELALLPYLALKRGF